MTETWGLLGTNTLILLASSNYFFISDFKKGDSEKPPTMNIKSIFDAFSIAA